MRKTSVAVLVFVAVVVASVLSVPLCWAWEETQKVPANMFLAPNYNWGFNLPMGGKSFFSFSWNIKCFEGGETLPTNKDRKLQICEGGNQRFLTFLLWRDPSVPPAEIEKMVFGFITGSHREPGKILCHDEVFPSDVDQGGILRDCEVPINFISGRYEFYASFYHFSSKLPNGKTFIGQDGKEKDKLEFTIWVRNGGQNYTKEVRDKIRELVSSIQVLSGVKTP